MIDREKIAHDLAIAYVINRHGPEVSGDIDAGSGQVTTERLPEVSAPSIRMGRTGGKGVFGLPAVGFVNTGGRKVDPDFRAMMDDYRAAYERFLDLLAET